jgi:uncharacterized protein YegL
MAARSLLAGLLLVGGSPVLPGGAAAGPGELRVELRDADTAARPGHLLATVALSGSAFDGGRLGAGAFRATGQRLAVLLLVDTSGSMRAGGNIGLARAAADRFATELRDGTRVGVVAFATRPRVVQPLTTDRRRVRAAIAGLRAAGDTALRDAVVQASRLLAREAGQRTVVLLSDGRDDGSRATFGQAVAAARAAKVGVYTIGLTVPGYEQDPLALRELSRRTGVRAVTGASGADLAGLYQRLGEELASQYVVDVELPAGHQRTAALALTAGRAAPAARSGGRCCSDRGPPGPQRRPACRRRLPSRRWNARRPATWSPRWGSPPPCSPAWRCWAPGPASPPVGCGGAWRRSRWWSPTGAPRRCSAPASWPAGPPPWPSRWSAAATSRRRSWTAWRRRG